MVMIAIMRIELTWLLESYHSACTAAATQADSAQLVSGRVGAASAVGTGE